MYSSHSSLFIWRLILATFENLRFLLYGSLLDESIHYESHESDESMNSHHEFSLNGECFVFLVLAHPNHKIVGKGSVWFGRQPQKDTYMNLSFASELRVLCLFASNKLAFFFLKTSHVFSDSLP
jgi:hypothetical protein